jgi:hypothetical protein
MASWQSVWSATSRGQGAGKSITVNSENPTMKSGLAARAQRYFTDAGRAFERGPVELSVAVAVAIAFSYAVEADGDAFMRWVEVAICGALIVCGAWAATTLHALGVLSVPRRWAVTLGVALLVGVYGTWVLDLERAAEAWRAAMLIGAALLCVLVLPWAGRLPATPATDASTSDDRILRMRVVSGRLALRVLGALLYCAALFAGLALALGAVNTLFELNLRGNI